jgi:lipopolysaccharide biosynthesis protein
LNWRHLRRWIATRLEWRSRERADCTLIENSGLFDRAWYLAQSPELARSRLDPILHYLRRGARDGRNPNPVFDGEWYLAQYPDVRTAGTNPLVHYLLHGAAEGREPGPFFDTPWYVTQHPDPCRGEATLSPQGDACVAPAIAGQLVATRHAPSLPPPSINPLAHYLRGGWHKGALPFDPACLLHGIKVAIVVHLFYADLWDEIAGWLRNIPIDFDLFVSVPRENARELGAMVRRDYPRAQLIAVPNAGRDVGAFLSVLPRVLAGNYSVLCKLHSKKGSDWRDLLLRGLLANKLLVARILHAFASDPDLALLGAREVYLSGPAQMTRNREKVEEITRLLHPGAGIPASWGFFAGTMFWARPDFLAPFALCGDRLFSFESDNTLRDGQLAHAFERAFGVLATVLGKRIGLTEITGLRPLEGTVHVTQAPGQPWAGSFPRVLRGHALRLSGELPFGRKLGSAAPVTPAAERVTQSSLAERAQGMIARYRIAAFMARWAARYPRLSRQAARALRLAWWVVSLQIVTRLRDACIKRAQARLVAASPLFDREWYLEQYPDVREAGVDPVLHYIAHGAAGYRDPGPRFDTAWYLAYYSDVGTSGVNPLVHYLLHGVKERRHPSPSDIVVGEVTEAALSCRKHPDAAGEISLFVTHSSDGGLEPHVRHHLEALRRHGIAAVLIVAADTDFREADAALLALVEGLYVRQNVGYDFAAWAHVLRENPNLLDADILYLINDSTIGPLNDRKFEDVLRKVRAGTSDVIGLTDSYERGWHIQSYFVALKRAALGSAALRAFIDKVKNLAEKRDVVNAYEARFAPIMQAAGLRCEVLFPAGRSYNPSLVDWRALIGSGLPFVKLTALRHSLRGFGGADWRHVLQSEGFDYRLAEQALARRP